MKGTYAIEDRKSKEKSRRDAFRKSHLEEIKHEDKIFHVRANKKLLYIVVSIILIPIIVAWVQYFVIGLPANIVYVNSSTISSNAPQGFPGWLRFMHYVNFIFLFLLIRSGLSILMDHPRLYLNNHCTPGTEMIQFTPIAVPSDRLWTAKDDNRYISPLVALPGGRHTVGVARSWHFISVFFFLLNGIIFVALLFLTNQWQRLVPTSWSIIPQAWGVFVHYATLHLPSEPDGFYAFNPLQQLSYFTVTLVMAPLSLLTGIAMSPAVDSRFPWFPKIFGGRQFARLLHFFLLVGYVGFIIIHVALVIMTGFARNMNHITIGIDSNSNIGIEIGVVGLLGALIIWALANYLAWSIPDKIQQIHRTMITPFTYFTMGKLPPHSRYQEADISPHFWPNGRLPVSGEWLTLLANNFEDYHLEVGGLVSKPITLSIDELKQMKDSEFITMHQCIQGWSGIAKWGGVSLSKIVDLVKPTAEAHAIAFYSYGEGPEGGQYYDTQLLSNVMQPECILAFEMNNEPLPKEYGAPLRLRVENQLGYKMVKWIKRIEFIQSEAVLGYGHGGKNEDDEYFDLIPNI